ncbi:MAG: hypothetical protein JST75_18510 [Bacteroidetes bacterium]|nr:hypothetical protein [Bacteroidota bacterium]
MWFRKPHILVACSFICSAGLAQRYPFVNYTPKNGLINSRTKSVSQDSKGRMYFLTFGGLSVYDGQKFENYSMSNGLASDLVNDIFEAAPDSMLIATNSNKLNTLVNGRVNFFETADHFCPVINKFFKAADGNLYVVSDEGLFILEEKKFKRIPLFEGTAESKDRFLNTIIQWNHYFLITAWVGADDVRLIIYDQLEHKTLDVSPPIQITGATINDRDQSVWLASANNLYQLDSSSLQQGKIKLISKSAWKQLGPGQIIGDIYFDRENNTWLRGAGMLIKIPPRGEYQIISSWQGLESSNIASLYFDREGVLWIATDGSGIIKMINTDVSIVSKLSDNDRADIFTLQCVNDTTWVYEKNKNSISFISGGSIRKFNLGKKISAKSILIFGKTLYLSDANRLYKIRDNNHVDAYAHPEEVLRLPADDMQFETGFIDSHGIIHFSVVQNKTFYLLDIFTDYSTSFHNINQLIDRFIEDKSNRLWVVTRAKSLYAFELHPEDKKNYLRMLHDYSPELNIPDPRSMTLDSSNNIWIGTRNSGIYCVEMDKMKIKSIRQYSIREGLTDNFVYSLACDGHNNIWAGTQNGLDKINCIGNKCSIENITRNNNIFQTIFHVDIDSKNTVWAVGNEGSAIKVINSDRQPGNFTPNLLLTSIRVNGTNLDVNSIPSHFSHLQNNISFNLAAPSFIDEKSINYRYQLNGITDTSWSEPSNKASFDFLNLDPGHYKLIVKAIFPSMKYAEKSLSFPFIIDPPFWQTWWFRLIVFLGVAVVILLLIRSYVKRKLKNQRTILERQQAIEIERTRIATDMHDDLGAGLTRIKFITENILEKTQDEKVRPDVEKLKKSSNELVEKMSEIIWAMNEKNNTLEDMLFYLRSYAVEYCNENNLACSFSLPEIIPANMVSGRVRRNVFMIVKESLHNVVKHATAKQVSITIDTGENLLVRIADDGSGFGKQEARTGNGLINMKKRAEAMQGKLIIQNNPATIIKLEVPI